MIYLPCVHMYIHTYKQTINQYKQKVLIHKSIQTYSYTYTWLQMVRPPPTHPQGGAGTLCVHVVSLCADTKTMTCRPCLDTYIHTYKQTINQYKQIVIIHKSIETYSYTYTWLQMVRPPQPTHRGGGAGTLCVHVVSLCADTKTMTCRPCLDTYLHTYKQTIKQYKQIVIIHKSIETYSYTYTWLQMVRPPPKGGIRHTYAAMYRYNYMFVLIYVCMPVCLSVCLLVCKYVRVPARSTCHCFCVCTQRYYMYT